jgi:hypothetical protein
LLGVMGITQLHDTDRGSLPPMTSPVEPTDRVAAESWFLARGLPGVLTRRGRWRRLWRRSAPLLAGTSTLVVCTVVIASTADNRTIDIDDNPTAAELVILAVLAVMLPLSFLVGWLVSHIATPRYRRLASTVAVIATLAAGLVTGPNADRIDAVVAIAVLVALILVLTGLGVGSVLAWALRLTMSHLATIGGLVARALPVVLLTVLVFFNGYVWSMATKISRERMWLVVGFMVLIAIAFLVTGMVERVRPVLASTSARGADGRRLADTPFAAMPDPITGENLSRGERANVIFVVAASQVIQVAMVAIVTAAIFFILGLLMLSPEVLATWTNNGPDQGTWLGMTLPVPQPLIHVTMFLAALTFMYVSARAVGDGEYRTQFLDPLVDDLRLTLVARNRYRAGVLPH